MKHSLILITIGMVLIIVSVIIYFVQKTSPVENVGAVSSFIYQQTILPITDSLYDLGTSTRAWRDLYVDQVCLTADSCKTAWPAGGASAYDAWTHPSAGVSATTTILRPAGVLVGTSTTGDIIATSSVSLPYLTNKILYTDALGKIVGVATSSLGYIVNLANSVTGVLPIANGGTNASQLSKALLWFNGSAIEATSSQVTVGNLVASTTATSTFLSQGIQVRGIQTGYIEATSTTASSTFSHGIIATKFGGTSATSSFTGVQIQSQGLKIGSISGFLKAVAGDVTTALIDLANDVTGTLPILNGGTNATRLSKALLWFDGTSIVATSSQVTVGNLVASTTATSTMLNQGLQVRGIQTGYIEATSTTATSTFSHGVIATSFGGTTATSSLTGLQILSGGLKIKNLTSCDSIDTTSTGDVVCGTDANSGGSAYPFTTDTNFGLTVSATSTPVWFQRGLMASTTSYFSDEINVVATTTHGGWDTGEGVVNIKNNNTGTGLQIESNSASDLISPMLYINYTGGAAGVNLLRIDSNSVSSQEQIRTNGLTNGWEMVETDQDNNHGKGKWEIHSNNKQFSLDSRAIDDGGFEKSFGFTQSSEGGAMQFTYPVATAGLTSEWADFSDRLTIIGGQASTTIPTGWKGYFSISTDTSGATHDGDPLRDVLAIDYNKNVGISTSTPGRRFSVEGSSLLGNSATAGFFVATSTATSTFAGGIQASILNITTSTSTFGNGINLTTGCFSIANTCITGGGASLSGGIDHTLAVWTGASSIAPTSTQPLYVGSLVATTTATSTFLKQGIQARAIQTSFIEATSTTASSTFSHGIIATKFGGTTATSSLSGLQILSGGLKVKTLTSCDSVDTNAAGDLVCGTDANSGGTVTGTGINNAIAAWTSTTGLQATSSNPLWLGSIFATSTATSTLINSGIQALRFFGDSLEATSSARVPWGTGVTLSVGGQVAIDTTSDQFAYFGTSKRILTYLDNLGFAYATTTWTGTTTLRIGPSPAAITVTRAYCETNTGTVAVSLYDGSNRALYMPTASTTINKFDYTASNNSFTAGETIRVDLGAPASSPTSISCRFLYSYDSD